MKSFAQNTLTDFLAALAAPTPAPGGGAAAAVSGATAAALVEMVAGLSLKKSPESADAALQQRTAAQMSAARGELLKFADDDANAYDAFIQAMRLPKIEESEREERGRAMSAAAERAAEIPLQTLCAITSIAEAARLLTGRSLVSAASDLEVALRFARAAGLSAAENVEVNLPFIDNSERRATLANQTTTSVAALERSTQS
ncbi:MAG: cyclodeaminase/cyclohydrolase family protein [Chloroflexi bacterium]|nr:cyclodeaminase/cyclohydrolase family protein [Chloroflexota bacterium]